MLVRIVYERWVNISKEFANIYIRALPTTFDLPYGMGDEVEKTIKEKFASFKVVLPLDFDSGYNEYITRLGEYFDGRCKICADIDAYRWAYNIMFSRTFRFTE
jgi:hypothetical protein